MKRWIFAFFFLLCLSLYAPALANGWGAPGDTVDLFDGTAYNDYNVTAEDYHRSHSKVHLVVANRYHQQLIIAEKNKGEWQIITASTKAVWQPGDPQVTSKWPELEWNSGGFTLLYQNESYHFDEELILTQAHCNGLDFTYQENDVYLVEQQGTSMLWHVPGGLFLPEFNIRQMPQNLEEVQRLNQWYQHVSTPFATEELPASEIKLDVYSAPDTQSWRAAKGKASVSLKDTSGLCAFTSVEEPGWLLIQYQVSMRTSRIGYIRLDAGFETEMPHGWHTLPVMTTSTTYFTDDPHVSQYQQSIIPASTAMVMLGRWQWDYAYVETTVDGKPARGFVPLRDIELHPDAPAIAAQALPGSYQCFEGGEVLGNSITFHHDGTYIADGNKTGTWEVTSIAHDNIHPLLLLTDDSGAVTSFILTLHTQGLSAACADGAGSGGYLLK